MYQVSTLQALLLGYFKGVISVGQLLMHGEIGLGTFEDVNGEMIVIDHKAYKADNQGNVRRADLKEGVPFAAVAHMEDSIAFDIPAGSSVNELKEALNELIDEDFGLNSMYVVRLDGFFSKLDARSELGQHSQHIELSEVLKLNQKDFEFHDKKGSLVCIYFPDYMDGINAAGWHFHFISEDRKLGGHVFDLSYGQLSGIRSQLHKIQIQLPTDKSFDTYELKSVSKDEVKKVEQ